MASDREWLARQLEAITDAEPILSPSQWAEENRILPEGSSAIPGPYRFSVAPYLREILDCFDPASPVREVAVMKGVQVCFTSGILENAIGYAIGHIKTAPCMFVTADAELAKLRMDGNIVPMIQASGLAGSIKSSVELNNRKSGITDKKIEWVGGGFLVPIGAVNQNKMRSLPIQNLFRDEIDGWATGATKDGDPMRLTKARTATFEDSRKILDGSTPGLKGQSRIESAFELGDKRRYFVRCVACGEAQVLRWRTVDADGVVSGISWDVDYKGHLVPGSARYNCCKCGHAHVNEDKIRMLDPAHGAEWRPTATPSAPHVRSYHLPALYSPVGMQSWDECVRQWLDAWDSENGRARDTEKLRVFYNNVLGESFENRGDRLRFETVSQHRRQALSYGSIDNDWAIDATGSPVLVVTCSVDVQSTWLAVAIIGWCANGRSVLIDYHRFDGNTEDLFDGATWGALREIVAERHYTSDDGRTYRVALTMVDSGYRADHVYQFCGEWESGVIVVKGRDTPSKGQNFKHFARFESPFGTVGYSVSVDIYKDRLSSALKREWIHGISKQPDWHFNAPRDATDKQLKELTAETKRERIDPKTGQRLGWVWHRTSGTRNELIDLMVYGMAAVDILAHAVCPPNEDAGQYTVDLNAFWHKLEEEELFFSRG